ncbi:LysR family transcriptional regulator [Salibacterium aidingense]|uniref:LysR family transcriptional regulator n=1 Tax=Salibacterium aidingense TaxID=384933 RepID=UPI003BC498A4
MDIENMEAFVKAAERGSISEAAAELNHLQSNMTAKIKKIETYYDQVLFHRHARGVTLTEAGERLYEQFRKMLLLWEETEEKMGRSGEKLRIGTMPSIGGAVFSGALETLYSSYPDLSVTFRTGSTEYLEEEVARGHLDLAYTIGAGHHKNVHYQRAGLEEMVIIGKDITPETDFYEYIDGRDVITLSRQCLYFSALDQIYTDYGLKQGEIMEVSDFETLVQFSTIGMGLAIVSKHVADRFHILDYLDIPSPYRFIDLYLICRRHHVFSDVEKQLMARSELA